MSADRTSHDEYAGRILQALAADETVSQRSLARELGIALGLTNLLVRRLVKRGLVRVAGIKPYRVRYLLTPAGIAEKARMSQLVFKNSVDRYRVARSRIRDAFERVSREWPRTDESKPIVFLGTGEVAEIGFICLQETDLHLVGAIDDQGKRKFFGAPVFGPAELTPELLASLGHARLIVMSLRETEELREEIAVSGVPSDYVTWI